VVATRPHTNSTLHRECLRKHMIRRDNSPLGHVAFATTFLTSLLSVFIRTLLALPRLVSFIFLTNLSIDISS
jgi:hypothetical protein